MLGLATTQKSKAWPNRTKVMMPTISCNNFWKAGAIQKNPKCTSTTRPKHLLNQKNFLAKKTV